MSCQIVEGWVLSVILGACSSRFVVGMDFVSFSVLLRGMLSPERRGDLRKGWSFLEESLSPAQEQHRLIPAVFVPTQRNSASQPLCSLTHSPGLLGAVAVPVVSPEPAAMAVLHLACSCWWMLRRSPASPSPVLLCRCKGLGLGQKTKNRGIW